MKRASRLWLGAFFIGACRSAGTCIGFRIGQTRYRNSDVGRERGCLRQRGNRRPENSSRAAGQSSLGDGWRYAPASNQLFEVSCTKHLRESAAHDATFPPNHLRLQRRRVWQAKPALSSGFHPGHCNGRVAWPRNVPCGCNQAPAANRTQIAGYRYPGALSWTIFLCGVLVASDVRRYFDH